MTARTERVALGLLLAIFIWFTWRGLTMFYSGDDMMNMYGAWKLNPWRLAKAQLFFWMPVYRPLGGGIYRVFYALFGFHPEPLYVFCWLLLVVNVVLSWQLFKVLLLTSAEALIALSLTLVHGTFQDLYLSAGTIYDRLWFFLTAAGLIAYAKFRTRAFVPVCLISILCMGSKESGVAMPALLFCYELLFHFPEARKTGTIRQWLRHIAPLFITLGAISVIFVLGRVKRTPELAATAAYQPHLSVSLWLTRVADYFSLLTYRHVSFTVLACAFVLALMAAGALLLRNRAMIFGLAFFIITVTPVALIAIRPGYVLYVPDLGLGLFFAALTGVAIRRLLPPPMTDRSGIIAFALVTLAAAWAHQRNWPAPFDPKNSPERRLTEQLRSDYPRMPPNSRLLFISDEFPKPAYDLLFNLRLMYRDDSIVAHRLEGPPDQQPDPKHPMTYDYVFAAGSGHYDELDNRDVAESIRLHILRDYAVGREMDSGRRDFAAYIVSGVASGDMSNSIRWTSPKATLKFDLFPAPAIFSAKIWVPEFVAKPALRTLSILVNGKEAGTVPLVKEGMNELSFPVPAGFISPAGFTLVDMNVSNPYRDAAGQEFGIVLVRAGFSYQPR